MSENKQSLREFVRLKALDLGMSELQFAKHCNLSPLTIYNLDKNKQSVKTLVAISKAIDVKPSELMKLSEESKK